MVAAFTAVVAVAAARHANGMRQTLNLTENEIMNHSVKNPTLFSFRLKTAGLLAVPLAAFLQVGEAQPPSQSTFASAEEASHVLFVAVQSHDTSTLRAILGPKDELISSSDDAQDELDRDQFVRKYRQMHRLARTANGEMLLYIGAENWPFPIPLVLRDGAWRYDSDTGEKEVLYRRIGENESAAIEACQALVMSVKQPEQNPLVSHGYSFRLLPNPDSNKPEFVAYPVLYGSSGVMTFIVNDAGVVYEKDLGANTETIVTKMTARPGDSTWTRVEAQLANSG